MRQVCEDSELTDGEIRYAPMADHYALRERVAIIESRVELKLDALAQQIERALPKPPNTLPVPYQPQGISRDDMLGALRSMKGGSVWQIALILVAAAFAYLFLHKWGIL